MRVAGKILALLVLLALVFFLVTYQDDDAPGGKAVVPEPREAAAPPALVETQQAFNDVYRRVMPAVVNISAEGMAAAEHPVFGELFGDLFKNQPRQKRKSLGSGVLIDPRGYLLTNAHVIDGAEQIEIRLCDERSYRAEVIGADDSTDVAVLKIEGDEPFPTARLGDSQALRVGEWAIAIGNPFGLDRTLTVGVISAKGRSDVGIEEYEDFIQTDASINPGNSGGPLLNIHGEVIGINTAIVASGQGIGFAIPIAMAQAIAEQLIETGEVRRGWLGVRIQDLTADLAESFGLERTRGALVTEVMPGTPAEKAGVKRGDIVLEFDGHLIRSVRDLQLRVANILSGTTSELVVLRDGKELVLMVTVSDREKAVSKLTPPAPEPKKTDRVEKSSFSVELEDDQVLVSRVDAQGAAAASGLRPGDKILEINDRQVRNLEEYNQAMTKLGDAGSLRLLVQRDEAVMYLAFSLR